MILLHALLLPLDHRANFSGQVALVERIAISSVGHVFTPLAFFENSAFVIGRYRSFEIDPAAAKSARNASALRGHVTFKERKFNTPSRVFRAW